MLLSGAYQNQDVVYDPDWLFISMIVVCFVILVLFVLLIVYCFQKQSWAVFIRNFIRYRNTNLNTNEKLRSIRVDNKCFDYLNEETEAQIRKRKLQKSSREVRYSEIEDIRQRLKNHLDRIKGNLFANTGLKDTEELDEFGFKVNLNNKSLMNELEKLKDLILHAKNQLANTNEVYPKEQEKHLSQSD